MSGWAFRHVRAPSYHFSSAPARDEKLFDDALRSFLSAADHLASAHRHQSAGAQLLEAQSLQDGGVATSSPPSRTGTPPVNRETKPDASVSGDVPMLDQALHEEAPSEVQRSKPEGERKDTEASSTPSPCKNSDGSGGARPQGVASQQNSPVLRKQTSAEKSPSVPHLRQDFALAPQDAVPAPTPDTAPTHPVEPSTQASVPYSQETISQPMPVHARPSSTGSQPSVPSSQPDTIAPRAHTTVPQSQAVDLQHQATSPQPQTIAPKAQTVATQPQTVAPQAHIGVPQVHAVSPQSQSIAPQTHPIAAQTPAVASRVPTTRPQADSIAPEARNIASQTKIVTPQTESITPQAQAVVPQPHTIAPQARTVIPQTQTIAPQAQVPHSQSQAVAGPVADRPPSLSPTQLGADTGAHLQQLPRVDARGNQNAQDAQKRAAALPTTALAERQPPAALQNDVSRTDGPSGGASDVRDRSHHAAPNGHESSSQEAVDSQQAALHVYEPPRVDRIPSYEEELAARGPIARPRTGQSSTSGASHSQQALPHGARELRLPVDIYQDPADRSLVCLLLETRDFDEWPGPRASERNALGSVRGASDAQPLADSNNPLNAGGVDATKSGLGGDKSSAHVPSPSSNPAAPSAVPPSNVTSAQDRGGATSISGDDAADSSDTQQDSSMDSADTSSDDELPHECRMFLHRERKRIRKQNAQIAQLSATRDVHWTMETLQLLPGLAYACDEDTTPTKFPPNIATIDPRSETAKDASVWKRSGMHRSRLAVITRVRKRYERLPRYQTGQTPSDEQPAESLHTTAKLFQKTYDDNVAVDDRPPSCIRLDRLAIIRRVRTRQFKKSLRPRGSQAQPVWPWISFPMDRAIPQCMCGGTACGTPDPPGSVAQNNDSTHGIQRPPAHPGNGHRNGFVPVGKKNSAR